MNLVKIGQIVNTHGIKGELRIISDFKFKKDVFKKGIKLYINKDVQTISTYRVHKMYDMITFEGINNINDVLMYKGQNVYIDKDEVLIKGVLDEDLIGLDVYNNDTYIGKVNSIMKTKANDILEVINEDKRHLIPNIKEFVLNVDLDNKKIQIEVIKGLLNED